MAAHSVSNKNEPTVNVCRGTGAVQHGSSKTGGALGFYQLDLAADKRYSLGSGRKMTEGRTRAERLDESMPTLRQLETSLRGKRMLGNIMGVHGPATPRGKQIADGYVRLVEKTILEYQASRERLVLFMDGDGDFDNYCRAQDHIESTVESLHRAILYLEQLRRQGFLQADGSPFVPKPRDLEALRDDVKARVRDLRDACEHLDKDIIGGKIPADSDVAVHVGWEGVDLAGTKITYVEMSRWIEQIHHFALLLSRVQILVGEPPHASQGPPNA